MKSFEALFSIFITILLMLGLNASASAAKKDKVPDLMKLCKAECPDAKDLKAVMDCVEGKEHSPSPDAFKKTKCYITHEKYEDQYNKMAGISGQNEAEKH